jgi:hypothetical protein
MGRENSDPQMTRMEPDRSVLVRIYARASIGLVGKQQHTALQDDSAVAVHNKDKFQLGQ